MHLTSVQIGKTTLELPILVFDIDDFSELDSIRGLSRERFNLLQINRKDFGVKQPNGNPKDWREWIESIMRSYDMDFPYGINKIELACTPKILGCRVNPIAVWYVYFDGDSLNAIIIEHNDTKGNRHHYVMCDNIRLSKKQGNTNAHGTLPNCEVNIDEYLRLRYKISNQNTVKYHANGEVWALLGKNLFKPFGNMKNVFKIIKRMMFFVLMPKTKKHSQSGVTLNSQ